MHLHQLELDLFNTLTGGVRRKMAAGELPECLMRHLLEHQKVSRRSLPLAQAACPRISARKRRLGVRRSGSARWVFVTLPPPRLSSC